MRILKFILLYCVLLLCACKKNKTTAIKDDLNGNGRLAGLLTYINPYNGDILSKPLANRKVYVAYSPSDSLNYIYAATTNSDGYFVFTSLDSTKKYDIFFNDTVNGIKYMAFMTVKPDSDRISLLATPNIKYQNGLMVSAHDIDSNKIQGITICAYDNFDIFNADTAAKLISNATYTFTTNQYGQYVQFNVAPGKYYFAAKKISGTFVLAGYDTINVGIAGVRQLNMLLSVVPNTQLDSAIITVLDSANYPVTAASVYLYSSYIAYSLDTAAAHAAFSYSVATTTSGIAQFSGIPVAPYFIRTDKTIGTIMFKGTGQVTLQQASTKKDTVHILRQ